MNTLTSRPSFFALGVLVGVGAVALARSEPRPSPEAVVPDAGGEAAQPAPPAGPSRVLPAGRAKAVAGAPQERREEAALPLFSPALLAYADDGIRTGWESLRSDELPAALQAEGMESFDEQVRALPVAVGRQLAARETQREEALADARTGGVFALLASLDEGGTGPMPELVRDRSGFAAFFKRDSTESFVSAAARIAQDEPVEDGTTLQFPAGVFELEDFLRKWSHPDPLARDLTVTGAGMDHTLLVGGDLSCYSKLRNLRLRDCTIFSPRGGLFDLRREAASVTLERVRLLGFDTGAGGSSAINTRALAIHFVDCEIIGGYGRSPGFGKLFDVRTDALLARFDRCKLEGLNVAVQHIRPGATVVFSNCTLREILDDGLVEAEQHPGVTFDACSFERAAQLDHAELREALRKDLNDRFANWEQELAKK